MPSPTRPPRPAPPPPPQRPRLPTANPVTHPAAAAIHAAAHATASPATNTADTDLVHRALAATQTVQAEGLLFKTGKSSSGYQGVFPNPRTRPGNGDPTFSTIVGPVIGQPFFLLGNYWTAEEGALAYARYHRDRLTTLGPTSGQPTTPAPPPPPAHTCPTAIITPNAAATSADHSADSAASAGAALTPADTAAYAPPLVTNHPTPAAASTCTIAPPPAPALAATPAISRRAADLEITSKCIETWSQAANGNFQYAVSPAAPLDHPPPLASSGPVDTAASASTDAIPSEPAHQRPGLHWACRRQPLGIGGPKDAFTDGGPRLPEPLGCQPRCPPGTTTSCAAGGAASSKAPIPTAPPNATGPANMAQITAHAAALAATAAAYATVASCTMAVCLNPTSRVGSLQNAAVVSLEKVIWGTTQAALEYRARQPPPLPDPPPPKRARLPMSGSSSGKSPQRPIAQPPLPDLVVSQTVLVQSLFKSSQTLLMAANLVETLSAQAGRTYSDEHGQSVDSLRDMAHKFHAIATTHNCSIAARHPHRARPAVPSALPAWLSAHNSSGARCFPLLRHLPCFHPAHGRHPVRRHTRPPSLADTFRDPPFSSVSRPRPRDWIC